MFSKKINPAQKNWLVWLSHTDDLIFFHHLHNFLPCASTGSEDGAHGIRYVRCYRHVDAFHGKIAHLREMARRVLDMPQEPVRQERCGIAWLVLKLELSYSTH